MRKNWEHASRTAGGFRLVRKGAVKSWRKFLKTKRREALLTGSRPGSAGENAAPREEHVQRPEASVLVHLPDGHGHPKLPGEDAPTQRDLQVHHGPVPVLPGKHAALAELAAPQPLFQRLLHQDPPQAGPARQGQLLGSAPQLRRHVRERELPAAPETLQGGQHAGRGPAGRQQAAGRGALSAAAGQAAAERAARSRAPPADAGRIQPELRLAAVRLQAPVRHREHHRQRVQDARRAGGLLHRRVPAAQPADPGLAAHVRLRDDGHCGPHLHGRQRLLGLRHAT